MKTSNANASRGCSLVSLLCAFALASSIWISRNFLQWSLITVPEKVLAMLWGFQSLATIFFFCPIRASPQSCPIWRAAGRGLLSLPMGCLLMAFIAIMFGAPVGLKYAARTLHWSLFMSSLTVVPAAVIFGSSWRDWQRVFAHNELLDGVDNALCFSAYGALIGAWFGAWPMPLDWERPWQEWPICVTYGTVIGYFAGSLISSIINFIGLQLSSKKSD